ncbi:hypothetical protein SEPCBS57363_004601 [Sporothrix epigloea]|uniref:SHSP domain-containing protein n=1 Tax=Sporothrix epigloea TaxID=1892477 RepID=A0ABP0DT66_9PEZI
MSEPNFPPHPWGFGVNMAFRPGPPGPPGPPPHHGRHHPNPFHHGPPAPPPPPPPSAPSAPSAPAGPSPVAAPSYDTPGTEKTPDNNNKGGCRWGHHGRHQHWGTRHADWETGPDMGMPWDGCWAAGPAAFGAGHHGHSHPFGHHGHGFGNFGFGPDFSPHGCGRWGWDHGNSATATGHETAAEPNLTGDAKSDGDDVITCSSSSSGSDDEEDVPMTEKDGSPSTLRGETPAAGVNATAAADAKVTDGDVFPPAETDAQSDGEKRRGCHGGYRGRHGAQGCHGNGAFFPHHGCRTRLDHSDGYFGPGGPVGLGGPHFSHHRYCRSAGPAGFPGHRGGHHHGHHHGRHVGRRCGPTGPFSHGGPFGRGGPSGPGGSFGPDGPFGPDGIGRRGCKFMMAALADHPVARNLRAYIDDATAASDNADHFNPPVDIFENDKQGGWTLHVGLPGASKEDIDVQWDADRSLLSISGIILRPGEKAFLKGLIQAERPIGLFQREVRLPPYEAETDSSPATAKQEVDAIGITARMDNGVLVVMVPTVDKEWTAVHQVDIEESG